MKHFSKTQLTNVEVYFGEPNEQIREGMRSTMRDYGMRRTRVFSRMEDLITAIKEVPPDLVIISDDMGPGMFDMVHDIRHFKYGRNPFVMISLLLDSKNDGYVKRAVLCGADDIIIKPVAPGRLMERITHIGMNRVPFIVTTDYLGPERRRAGDARPSKIKQLNVLNTLKAKADGKPMTSSELNQAVKENMKDVMSARLDSHGLKLGWVCAQILKAYSEERIDQELEQRLLLLATVLDDAARSALDIGERDLSEICVDMARQVEEMAEDYQNPTAPQIATLNKLTKAFEMAKSAKAT